VTLTSVEFRHVDTHFHLDLFPNAQEVIGMIEHDRVFTIAVTNAPFLFAHTQDLCRQSPLLLPALGMHPELVHSHGNQIDQFRQLLPSTRFVGEVGLDYVTPDSANRDLQKRTFETILGWCADAGDKILTVHSRRSAADVVAAIGDRFTGTVILHWFSGALRDQRKAVANGLYFSVNPAMILSEQGMHTVREIPRDRLLTETDGPFVTIAGKPAIPGSTKQVCEALAELWGCPPEDASEAVRANFERVTAPRT
jgi:TatD DNase family protein